MNKKIFAIIIAALMCMLCPLSSFAAQADDTTKFIVDEIGYIFDDEIELLTDQSYSVYNSCGVAVFVVFTLDEVDSYNASYYVGDVDDYVIMIENQDYYNIFAGGKAESKIDNDTKLALRSSYDEMDTYRSGISAFISEVGALFGYADDNVATGDAYTPTADGNKLYDGADILTDGEEASLLAKLEELSTQYKVDVAIATVDGTTGDMTADEYVEYYFDNSGLGAGDTRDAVLFLVDMNARVFRILSNGKIGAAAVSSGDISSITEMVSSDMKADDYYSAFNTYIDEAEYQIDGEINGFPFKFFRNLIISLVIGFVVAFIVTGSMKSKLKSVKKRSAANSYVIPGSLYINDSRDNFLYSHITKTKKESKSSSSSNSSSGGSSRNVGGGSF